MKYIICFPLFFHFITQGLALCATNEVDMLLDQIDKIYRSDSSISTMEMRIVTPYWQRSLKMKAWTQGLEKTFITVLYPRKEKGVSTLKVRNEMWNYFPKINKVIKIPSSMMMGAWMGSDFTNDDLVKESTLREDYDYIVLKKEGVIYTIELKPKDYVATVWGKIHLVVDSKKNIPLYQEFYDEKGKMVRKMTFDELKIIDDRFIPMRMTLTPLTKPGHQTIVEYIEIKGVLF
jgi:outer membrane lipoprotein-sorting protein